MIVIPAIDIRTGRVVRLIQGDFTKETVYSGDPVNMAKRWEKEGALMLHIVDLDGAYSGRSSNLSYVKEIVSSLRILVELGGGLRSESEVDKALACGIKRAVLGTRAYKDEAFLKRLVKKYPNQIAVSIDAVKGKIISEGWKTQTAIDAKALAIRIGEIGISCIIFTDILKDGTMTGPNMDSIKEVLDSVSYDVIVSGGISSLDDIKSLKALGKKNLSGVIVGKALYEGAFTLAQANEVVK
ncbi:MAG: 1-(5-phosphoribosyl)-5-[(5-phosphoribosylamino)methylideneamino]imidazole-4-carboxamide isomerase [Candidatus Omnitrophota bacterium]